MTLSDQEIRQTYKLFIDKNDILNFELTGSVSTSEDNVLQAQMIKSDVESFIEEGKTVKVLANLTPEGQDANYPTPVAKEIYIQIIENDKIEKIAFIIKSFLLSSIMRFIMGSNKMSELKIFKNKEDAIKWLLIEGEENQGFHVEPE